MKGLDTGQEKLQKICDALKKETLDPAKQEAKEIVENAHLEAEEILQKAKKQADKKLKEAEELIEEKRRVLQASLELSSRQALETLKQKIEEELFQSELSALIEKQMGDPKWIAEILNTLFEILEKRGEESNFFVEIPKTITPDSIISHLVKKVKEKWEGKVAALGGFQGGVKISSKAGAFTIDITDQALKELVGNYIRRDFRHFIFQEA